jgi:hypothetical protein
MTAGLKTRWWPGKHTRPAEPFFQERHPPPRIDPVDSDGDGLAGADQDDELSAARESGIQQIPLQQGVIPPVIRQSKS